MQRFNYIAEGTSVCAARNELRGKWRRNIREIGNEIGDIEIIGPAYCRLPTYEHTRPFSRETAANKLPRAHNAAAQSSLRECACVSRVGRYIVVTSTTGSRAVGRNSYAWASHRHTRHLPRAANVKRRNFVRVKKNKTVTQRATIRQIK